MTVDRLATGDRGWVHGGPGQVGRLTRQTGEKPGSADGFVRPTSMFQHFDKCARNREQGWLIQVNAKRLPGCIGFYAGTRGENPW